MSEDLEKKEEKVEEKTAEKAEVNPNGGRGFAIASMVLGIVSIPMLCTFYLAIPCGILAIVFAVVAKKKAEKNGMSVAGLVLGIVSLSIAGIILCFVIIAGVTFSSIVNKITSDSSYSSSYDYYNDYYNYDSSDF